MARRQAKEPVLDAKKSSGSSLKRATFGRYERTTILIEIDDRHVGLCQSIADRGQPGHCSSE
jgi:hypothetical protein